MPGTKVQVEEHNMDEAERQDTANKPRKPLGKHKECFNKYATKKTLASGLFDIGLLIANAAQIKALLDVGKDAQDHYYLLLSLIIISIVLQLTVGVMFLILGNLDCEQLENEHVHLLNDVTVVFASAVTVVNAIIGAFGIKTSGIEPGTSHTAAGHSTTETVLNAVIAFLDCAVSPSVYDENIPQSLLVPCPSLYVQPEYGPQDGVYVPNGSLGSGRHPAYVPVYHHPVNTPCTCHLHYPSPPTSAPPTSHKHSRDQRTLKDSNSTSPRNNQRMNGIMGCMHHHVNNMNVNPAWHRHAYTLPYLPGHHVHQVQTYAPKVPPRQQSQLSRNNKDSSTSPRQLQGKPASTSASPSNGQSVSTSHSDDV